MKKCDRISGRSDIWAITVQYSVTPAKAGVQEALWDANKPVYWIPAFAGKTGRGHWGWNAGDLEDGSRTSRSNAGYFGYGSRASGIERRQF